MDHKSVFVFRFARVSTWRKLSSIDPESPTHTIFTKLNGFYTVNAAK